jgi:hypothetical protein
MDKKLTIRKPRVKKVNPENDNVTTNKGIQKKGKKNSPAVPPSGASVEGLSGSPSGASVEGLSGSPSGASVEGSVEGLSGSPSGASVEGLSGPPSGASMEGHVKGVRKRDKSSAVVTHSIGRDNTRKRKHKNKLDLQLDSNPIHSRQFDIHSLPSRHLALITPYLHLIHHDFHHLFRDISLYHDISFIHAFIFFVWHSSIISSHSTFIIHNSLAILPFHSLLSLISHADQETPI